MFSFSSVFYSQSLCTLFHIRLFAVSLQKSVDRNFGSCSSSLEVQQRLLNQSRWGGPGRNPGLVSARADHGEQNQLVLTGVGNLRSRFPQGHWQDAWDWYVQHTQTSVPRKWRCWVMVVTLKMHLNEAAVMLPSAGGTGFSMIECALLFVFSALSLNDGDGTGRLSLDLAEGSWPYLSKSEKCGTKVWLWCVGFWGYVLFFQKWLVTVAVKDENWAKRPGLFAKVLLNNWPL